MDRLLVAELLDAYRAGREGSGSERERVRRALMSRACWPDDMCAEMLRSFPFPEASVGGATIVTAADERAALWVLEPRNEAECRQVPLGAVARQAVEIARSVVSRDVAALARPDVLLRPTPWCARLLARRGSGRDESVDGRSLGLAAALAHLSAFAGVPVPPDLLTSATLDGDGTLGPVAGWKRKLDVMQHWGLGVRRLIVASAQAQQVQSVCDELGLMVAVIGARSVNEVVQQAFPELFEKLQARWRSQPKQAAEVARTLFDLALRNTPLLQDWHGFAKTANAMVEVLSDTEPRRRAEIAARIAERHAGQPAPICFDAEWWRQQRRPTRMRLLSHEVQAAADAASAGWEAAATRAEKELQDPREMVGEDFRLLGALGRLYAAEHRFERAVDVLRQAIEGWFDVGELPEASHPACEFARLLGVLGRPAEFDELHQRHLARILVDPRLSPKSRAFLELAVVRAYVQLGRPEDARVRLEDARSTFESAPRHVYASALRWELHTLSGTCERSEVIHAKVRKLAEQSPADAGFAHALCDLERGRASLHEVLDALRGMPQPRRELQRLERVATGELAPFVARHWRY